MRQRQTGAALIMAVLLAAGSVEAQQVRRVGRGEPRLDARIDEIIGDRSYRVLARDTLISTTDTLRGPILALDNRLIIEGTVIGDLAMIDANVYLRPTARVEGDVTNIGSGLYRAELAVITGRLTDYPLAPYHVEREGENFTVVGDVEFRLIRPNLLLPTATRVDGVMPRLGATLALPPAGRLQVELGVWGGYGLEHGDWKEALQGGAELRLRHGFNHLGVGVEETTATQDGWIRSDIKNTLSFLYQGKDYRNYYEAERQYVMVARELIRGPHAAVLSVRAQREDAESMLKKSPWVLFEPDSFRTNPAIDDGIISSGILGLRGEWTGVTAVAGYDGNLELGLEDFAGGDFDFVAYTASARWAMLALANHTLELEARFQGPIGTDSLPHQRWGMMGGSGTLYTFSVGQFYGDRLAYLETEYSIPFPRRFRVPYLGIPAFELLHSIGMAWTHNASRDFEQNVGVRLQFPFVFARLVTNPADTEQTKFSVGVTTPKLVYPWQRSGN